MKSYTTEEKNEARKKLPEPIIDFLGSEALTSIYLGIRDKLKLNLRQLMVVSEIANVTLTGLEPEQALEANLRQYMPELSNTEMQELVTDLNDRVFKEAQRRLHENIVEPKEEISLRLTPDGEPFIKEEVKATSPDETSKEDRGKTSAPPEAQEPIVLPSILKERLAAPTMTKADPKDIPRPPSGIQQVSVPPPQAPRIYKGGDPYREPVE